jgi:hypothetical protein
MTLIRTVMVVLSPPGPYPANLQRDAGCSLRVGSNGFRGKGASSVCALRLDVLRYAASASSDRCIAAIPASIAFDRKPLASSGRKSAVQTTEVKPSASSETWSAAL